MKCEVAYSRETGKFYITLTSMELVEKFIDEVEDMTTSRAFNRQWEEVRDLTGFLLDLKKERERASHTMSTGFSEDEIDFKEEENGRKDQGNRETAG